MRLLRKSELTFLKKKMEALMLNLWISTKDINQNFIFLDTLKS